MVDIRPVRLEKLSTSWRCHETAVTGAATRRSHAIITFFKPIFQELHEMGNRQSWEHSISSTNSASESPTARPFLPPLLRSPLYSTPELSFTIMGRPVMDLKNSAGFLSDIAHRVVQFGGASPSPLHPPPSAIFPDSATYECDQWDSPNSARRRYMSEPRCCPAPLCPPTRAPSVMLCRSWFSCVRPTAGLMWACGSWLRQRVQGIGRPHR